jgi:hypothetical protein
MIPAGKSVQARSSNRASQGACDGNLIAECDSRASSGCA